MTVSGIMLSSHKADELKHSLQGAISAVDLGVWYQKYGERLLDDNVRFARRSRVNDEIRRTLLEEPDLFWALHGDVIAVCDTWEQSAVLGRNVPYTFHGLRIVNGAQTSAILGRALRAAQEQGPAAVEQLAKAEVPIRFLKLSTRPAGFGAQAAFTHNRINDVTSRDKLAMQHVQQSLRSDFTLAWGETYLVRADERPPKGVTSYSVLEGVLAMACARLDVPALTEAKDDIEALWPGDRDLYDQMFSARPRDRTSAAEVRRRIIALRAINSALHADGTCRTEREKEVAVLGDFLIAHIVFQRLGSDGIEDVASGWDERLAIIPGHVRTALRSLSAAVTGQLAKRGAPEPGRGFRRVSGVLQDDEWLAGAVQRAVTAEETTEPTGAAPGAAWRSESEFWLRIRGVPLAQGRRCDGGFLVYAGSAATLEEWPSLTTPQRRHRRNLRGTLGLAPAAGGLLLTRDALFESPSQAAAVMVGHSANGADEWVAPAGRSYNRVVRDEATSSP